MQESSFLRLLSDTVKQTPKKLLKSLILSIITES